MTHHPLSAPAAWRSGEDPLEEGCTAHDLDSVAGVLKLYFRSLQPPIFPPDLFGELLAPAGEAGRGRGPGAAGGGLPSGHGRGHGPHALLSWLLAGPQSWRPRQSAWSR